MDFVHSFLVSEDDFETVKEVLEYLDPEEGAALPIVGVILFIVLKPEEL